MLRISSHVAIPDSEIEIHSVRAQEAERQHVNKVSTAVHLQFDIKASPLPPSCKQTLLELRDHRISSDGVMTIKSREHRSRERNRQQAVARLLALIQKSDRSANKAQTHLPTNPSRERRIASKKRRGRLRSQRKELE
ncbi:MAG: aminoacyl-tRNA hydrolase, partial [Nitrospira sp.]|nr:aminoacyl-tRNA hydrolase [Nitrospira sp.]